MAKKYKLSSVEARAWRTNKPQWVSPEGIVLRAVTPEEEAAIFPAIERAKKVAKGGGNRATVGQAMVTAVYLRKDDHGTDTRHEVPLELTFRVTPTGREATNYVLDVFCNGNKYVKGRDIIKSRLLQKHGETIVNGMNGKRLDIVRDPRLKRPSYTESQRDTPTPEHCTCRGWKDRSDIHRHHPACQWNAKAPPHERALPTTVVMEQHSLITDPEPLGDLAFGPLSSRATAGAVPSRRAMAAPADPFDRPEPIPSAPGAMMRAPHHVMPGMPVQSTRVPRTILQAVSPAECPEDCRGVINPSLAWEWPAGRKDEADQHHPFCQYDASWRARDGEQKRWSLYDVRVGKEVREATNDEVARAEVEYGRSGTRSIELGGTIYAVVPSGEGIETLDPSARRQRARQMESATSPIAEFIGAPLPRARQREAESRRTAALERSGLPFDGSNGFESVDRQLTPEQIAEAARQAEIVSLRARLAMMEGRAPAPPASFSAPTSFTLDLQSAPPAAAAVELNPRVVSPPAEHLRDELGLVGLQRLTDDIPPGPVLLHEPEAFVDPLAVEREQRARDRQTLAMKGPPPPAPPPPPPPPGRVTGEDGASLAPMSYSHDDLQSGVTDAAAGGIVSAAL